MNTFGVSVGMAALLIIGLGFPLVILGERYFGYLWWPYWLGIGLLSIMSSLLVRQDVVSAVIGVIGATFIWGSTELKGQSGRVDAGLFPQHSQKIKPPLEGIIQRWKAPRL